MNNPNPLMPQGALPPKAKSPLYFKVLTVVAVHVVVIGGILIVGCKDTTKLSSSPKSDVADAPKDPMTPTDIPPTTPTSSPMTASTPTAPAPTTPVTATPSTPTTTAALPPLPGTMPTAPASSAPMTPNMTTPVAPAPTAASTYVIASGDLLSTIAKKNNVTVKALEEANPGVDAKKLKIGHKLNIPASAAIASTTTTGGGVPTMDPAPTTGGDSMTYVVKAGDSLTKIAKSRGTTYKALEALNDMKTSNIKVGQKLKVPVMKVASVDAPAPSTATPASTPAIRAN